MPFVKRGFGSGLAGSEGSLVSIKLV